MIEFYVSGQTLKFFTPVIAADSLNYLTVKVNFTDAEWDGYSKWLHFRQDEELGAITYDIQLNEDNEIVAADKLNLTVGQWEIYLTGTMEDSRLTTVPVILTVQESGLIDAPLHELPMSVAERVDFNAKQALLLAQAVKDMADAGEFDGTSFSPLGHFNSAEELEALVAEPQPGDVYSVGVAPPYNIYVWDGVNLLWRNQGKLQGATGEKGDPGATFFPIVDSNGLISWTNDGGYDNPKPQNIRGPKGEKGNDGADGKSPYDIAQEHGYTGTEETLNNAIKDFPSHHARHLPDGADPILVKTDNIDNRAVTAAKLSDSLKTKWFTALVPVEWTGNGPYVQTVHDEGLEGLSSTDRPMVWFKPPENFSDVEGAREAFSKLYVSDSGENSITLYALEEPEAAFSIYVEVNHI